MKNFHSYSPDDNSDSGDPLRPRPGNDTQSRYGAEVVPPLVHTLKDVLAAISPSLEFQQAANRLAGRDATELAQLQPEESGFRLADLEELRLEALAGWNSYQEQYDLLSILVEESWSLSNPQGQQQFATAAYQSLDEIQAALQSFMDSARELRMLEEADVDVFLKKLSGLKAYARVVA